MVQGTQRFRQVRAKSCVIPYVLCGGLYCLRCWLFRGGPCPPLYIRGDRLTWKVLAEYSWSPTTARSGSFFCTAASSTPIRVVTREVRYIHDLSLILELSLSISSPAAQSLTFGNTNSVPQKVGTDRFLQKLGTEEIRYWYFRFGSGIYRKNRTDYNDMQYQVSIANFEQIQHDSIENNSIKIIHIKGHNTTWVDYCKYVTKLSINT